MSSVEPAVEAIRHARSRLQAKDPLDACHGADALAILTPWPQFRSVAPGDVAAAMKGRVLLDPYRILDPQACRAAGLQQAVLGAP